MALPSLPIDAHLPTLLGALRTHSRVILQAPPGAGKTSRIPRALLDGAIAGTGQIILLEPRRLAARAAARHFSARHMNEPSAIEPWLSSAIEAIGGDLTVDVSL